MGKELPQRLLFFDCETTGLPLNYKAPVEDLGNWPRLVQLAWIMFDAEGRQLSSHDFTILPDGYQISDEVAELHGITDQLANEIGHKIAPVLQLFSRDIMRTEALVAHNMDFDEKIVGSEMVRAGNENDLILSPRICTMKLSTDLCAIPGRYGKFKWPKLQELHMKLFGEEFEEAHNAMADIQATAKCFFEMLRIDIFEL